MKKKGNEKKEEFQGCSCRACGMNGVGKQTNSIHDSIKRSVIKRMDDGKGIGRRVNQNPSSRGTPTEFKGRGPIC